MPFLPPDPDDPTIVTVRSQLIEVGREKKKKQIKRFIVEPSVCEQLGAPRMVGALGGVRGATFVVILFFVHFYGKDFVGATDTYVECTG
jgi:hypothetical protein